MVYTYMNHINLIIDRVVAGESVAQVVTEITTSATIPARPPKPLGLFRNKPRRKGQGRLPYIGFREPQKSPAPTSHRSYETVDELSRTWPASYTGGYSSPSAALAAKTKTAKPFSRHDPEYNPWLAAIKAKKFRGLNVGFGKSRAMGYRWP